MKQQSSPTSPNRWRSRTSRSPQPGPGQVLVRIEACGLCHTDIHAARGDWPVKPTPPFIPGHEGVGIVEALGSGVTTRPVGDRVAIPWLGHACGHCATASAAGRPCASSSRTPATRSTAGSPSTPSPTPTTSSPVPEGIILAGRRAADLRRRHDVQGRQGRQHRPERAGRDLRRRRPRPPRGAVRAARRRDRHRRRRRGREAPARRATSAPTMSSTPRKRPGRGDPGSRRSRRRDRHWLPSRVVRAGLRLASPGRAPGLRRACRRTDAMTLPIFADRAQGHLGDRLDRRHPAGPRRGLRAARRGPHPGDHRDPQARRGQRPRWKRCSRAMCPARLVFEF